MAELSEEFTGTFMSAPGATFGSVSYRIGAVLRGVVGLGFNNSGRLYASGILINMRSGVPASKQIRRREMYRRRYERRRVTG